MTTTSWTTTSDVPPSAWAALVSDIRTLLGLLGAGGAKVTDPSGSTAPVLGAERIAFTVTLPERGPLTVQFTRAAGDGQVETSSPLTDGLVLAALQRAGRHWGQLLTSTSDAGTEARAICSTVVEGLFGAGDRNVVGGAALSVPAQVQQAVAEAQDVVARAEFAEQQAAVEKLGVDDEVPVAIEAAAYDAVTYLSAVITELEAHRDGVAAALGLMPKPAS